MRAPFSRASSVTGVFLTVQAALPLMRAGGAIVLNGSVMRELGRAGTAAYSSSKAAVTGMPKVFASELAAPATTWPPQKPNSRPASP